MAMGVDSTDVWAFPPSDLDDRHNQNIVIAAARATIVITISDRRCFFISVANVS